MTAQEIITLIQAGYTKADIDAMAGAAESKPEATETAAPKAEETITMTKAQLEELLATKTAPAQPEKPIEKTEPAPASSVLSGDQFTQLLQSIKAGTVAVDVPPTVNIDTMLAERYTMLTVGDAKKGD